MGKSTISMAIFNSYVKLPEGKKHMIFQILQIFQNPQPGFPGSPTVMVIYQL